MKTSVQETVEHSASPARPAAAKPSVKPSGKPLPIHNTYHRKRKLIQLVCFLIFLALPFFNVMRFDIPRQRFFFVGYELWINEFAIIFFSLLFFALCDRGGLDAVRARLLRLSLPADDLQRSLAQAGRAVGQVRQQTLHQS
jgi:hypothetical protein